MLGKQLPGQPPLENRDARVLGFVDPMAEAHELFFGFQEKQRPLTQLGIVCSANGPSPHWMPRTASRVTHIGVAQADGEVVGPDAVENDTRFILMSRGMPPAVLTLPRCP